MWTLFFFFFWSWYFIVAFWGFFDNQRFRSSGCSHNLSSDICDLTIAWAHWCWDHTERVRDAKNKTMTRQFTTLSSDFWWRLHFFVCYLNLFGWHVQLFLREPDSTLQICEYECARVKNEPQADGVVLVRRFTASRTPSMSRRNRTCFQLHTLSFTIDPLVLILKHKRWYLMDSSLKAPHINLHRLNPALFTLPQIP